MFAGPSWTWRDLGVLDDPTWAQKRRARIDSRSLENCPSTAAAITSKRSGCAAGAN